MQLLEKIGDDEKRDGREELDGGFEYDDSPVFVGMISIPKRCRDLSDGGGRMNAKESVELGEIAGQSLSVRYTT